MRLNPSDQQIIRQAIKKADPDAKIYLFGSRADDHARGGDIDLLVISKKIRLMDKLAVLAELHQTLGEQQIDLAVFPDFSRPFTRIAKQTGVAL